VSEGVGLYPGSFDPITFGHVDLIRRSLSVVDRLVVAILPNATKEALLTLAEREALLRAVIGEQLGADARRRIKSRRSRC
jgi:pantetheine-phosphate adenylyltransferase